MRHCVVSPMAGRRSIEEGFHHRVVDGGGEWMAGVEEGSGWWFSLDLGVEIDGATVPLLVFVYKLLAQGTVEERMLESQQRKKALAAGIYQAGGNAAAALTAADIERLFTPLG